MISPLICGSFQDQQDEDLELLRSWTSPKSRKPAKWHSFGAKSNKGNKNPYADRGLDKFSALLAELDSKRQKIYMQKGSEDISLLGFVYSNSDDYKPIVVRLKNKKQPNISSEKDKPKTNDIISSPPATSSEIEPANANQVKTISRIVSNIKTSPRTVRFDLLKNIVLENSRQPAYYVPLITILILIFLIIFGRSFAILCTTLCWYCVPMIHSFDYKKPRTPKTKTAKKDYAKALSYSGNLTTTSHDHEISNLKKTKVMKKAMSYNNKFVKSGTSDHGLSSPRSVLNGYKSPPTPASPPPQQDHRRNFPR